MIYKTRNSSAKPNRSHRPGLNQVRIGLRLWIAVLSTCAPFALSCTNLPTLALPFTPVSPRMVASPSDSPQRTLGSTARARAYQEGLFSGLSEDDRSRKQKKIRSAFSLLRATTDQFYQDMFHHPDLKLRSAQMALSPQKKYFETMISADNHIENFSWLPISASTTINSDPSGPFELTRDDYDEAVIGQWHFDIVRLLASIQVLARENGYSPTEIQAATTIAALWFVQTIEELSQVEMTSQPQKEELISATWTTKAKFLNSSLDEIRTYPADRALKKWTIQQFEKQAPRFRDDSSQPKLTQQIAALERRSPIYDQVLNALLEYEKRTRQNWDFPDDYFKVLDVAHRFNAGVGSLGTPRFYVLIKGSQRPVILDLKAIPEPAYFPYLSPEQRQAYKQQFGENHALRAQFSHSLMGKDQDPHSGWLYLDAELSPKYFAVQEISPYRGGFPSEKMKIPSATLTAQEREQSSANLYDAAKTLGIVTVLGQNRAHRAIAKTAGESHGQKSFAHLAAEIIHTYERRFNVKFTADLEQLSATYARIINEDFELLVKTGVLEGR